MVLADIAREVAGLVHQYWVALLPGFRVERGAGVEIDTVPTFILSEEISG